MAHEKLVVLIVMVAGFVLFLSASPDFTGSVIKEGLNNELLVQEALEGTTVRAHVIVTPEESQIVNLRVTPSGEAGNWITLEQEEYRVVPMEDNKIFFEITIPEGTEEKEYKAKLALMYVGDFNKKSIFEDQIIDYVDIVIDVTSQPSIGKIRVNSLEVLDIEEGSPIHTLMELENLGNTPINTEAEVSVFSPEGTNIGTAKMQIDLKSYDRSQKVVVVDSLTTIGEHTAKLTLEEDTKLTHFNVLPKEGLKTEGDLLFTEIDKTVDGEVTIRAYFKNTGKSVLEPKLSGTVLKNDDVIHGFETETVKVLPGKFNTFEYTYSTQLLGEYHLRTEIIDHNSVLDRIDEKFYSTNAISLESNFFVIFSLVLFTLIVSHYLLTRRKRK